MPLATSPRDRAPAAARLPRLPGPNAGLLVASTALAAASLGFPAVLGYDPWAWLVWGRELTRGELSLAAGPSWKPLPVLVTTALAPLGDAAPALWLVVARTGGLLAVALAYRLAARLAPPGGRVVAGAVAVVALLLTPDAEARWIRHMLQGNVEPLTVGLSLLAVQRHLDGRPWQAVLLGGAAALLRPELGPLLALYGLWLVRREPRRAVLVGPVLAAVPAAWLGGDWWATGDPLTGATRAQVVLDEPVGGRLLLALGQIGDSVALPVWVGALGSVVWAARRRQPVPVVLAAGALALMAVVAAMTVVLGYGALSRFLAVPAAVLCVLAGTAAGRAVAAPRRRALRVAVAATLAAAAVPAVLPRAQWVPAQVAAAAERAGLAADLDRAVALAGGREALLACGAFAIDAEQVAVQQSRPELSWKLDVPLARVGYGLGAGSGVVFAVTGGATDRSLAGAPAPVVRPVARTAGWTVYAVRCPAL